MKLMLLVFLVVASMVDGGMGQQPDLDIDTICEMSRNCEGRVDTAVCGTDDNTYDSTCDFLTYKCDNNDLELLIAQFAACGEEPDKSFLAADDPELDIDAICDISRNCDGTVDAELCGTDDNTYDNTCDLLIYKCENTDLETVIEEFGECEEGEFRPDPEEKRAFCEHRFECCYNRTSMSELESPVCGSDNVTYENICEYKIAKCVDIFLTIAKRGECTEDQGIPERYCVRCPFVYHGNRGNPRPNKGGKPEGERPEGGKPGGGRPEGGRPEGGRPEGGRPGGRPDGGRPQGGRPHGGRPQGGKPEGGRPEGGRPQGGRPHGGKPEGGRPEGGRPQGGRPQGGRPEGGRPEGGKPHGGRHEGGRHVCGKPRGERPEGGRPGGRRPEGGKRGGNFLENPVCGTDGVTYASACELKRTACLLREFDLDIESFEPCESTSPTPETTDALPTLP